ncbi:hypothetical protein KZZ52_52355 [Dactylosporangium sp. AC04546]|uniref:hypothetical protein n=1 Tax=Dactylosporangium sp. AC04546 TaxID=2862460 RepID=UPI001EDCB94F|nr:hypothetical protein [Dactylosporangium sp. AC04546]WVK82456.1 hypothetical protein KZZ52_52355 [Dactylosporangium sp. AC04546]
MTTLNASVARAVHWHRPLMALSAAMAVLALACSAGLLLDHRTVIGAPVWLKPFKFSLSLMVYCLTLAWMITLVGRGRRLADRAGTVIAISAAGEMLLIVGQAARGRASHFNTTTPLDDVIRLTMGATIMFLWAGTLILGVLLFRTAVADRANRWAVRLGVVLSLVGMSLGALMVLPNAAQRRALESGVDTVIGAHSVGVADGGPGMPLTGWSATGGDLRIPHFVGLHALQALPLLALLLAVLAQRLPRLTEQRRARLVLLAAALFTGVLAVVTWQALRGEPLVHPGAVTLTAAGLLAAAGVGGTAAALR